MNRQLLRSVCPALLLACLPTVPSLAQEEDGSPRRRGGENGPRPRLEAWESLDPEQRTKLREALRVVWTDPAVINAREEVKQASEVYQATIKSAVERVDPSLAELLSRVRNVDGLGPGRGGPGAPPRDLDGPIRPPGFLDSLPPEAREKFRKAEEAALKSEAVKAARAELAQIREEDEALRRKRIEAHRKLRKATVEEMIRVDPSVAEIQKRLSGGERDGERPPRKDGEGRKGKAGAPDGKKDSDAPPVQ